MDIYIARQPILDRQKRLFAYEVLYRSSMDNFFPADMGSDEATHTVLAHVLFNIGLDTITGSQKALINFPQNHLIQRTPTQLPQKRCIIEILESTLPSPEIFSACQELKGILKFSSVSPGSAYRQIFLRKSCFSAAH
jgi:EAL and modified HD-GYP domain-containing signal transduction protein